MGFDGNSAITGYDIECKNKSGKSLISSDFISAEKALLFFAFLMDFTCKKNVDSGKLRGGTFYQFCLFPCTKYTHVSCGGSGFLWRWLRWVSPASFLFEPAGPLSDCSLWPLWQCHHRWPHGLLPTRPGPCHYIFYLPGFPLLPSCPNP